MLSADGQQQRLQRLPLGERLPGGDRHQRVAVADLRRVGGCLRRLDRDVRAGSVRGQGMVVQDHVRGHHLGDAGDRRRPGRARAVHHAGCRRCQRPRPRRPATRPRPAGPGAERPTRLRRGRSGGPRRRPGQDRRPDGDLCSFAMTKPARQPSAARQANAVRSVRLVPPRPVTGSCSVRPPRGPAARWVHACDGAIPVSSACPATVTAVSHGGNGYRCRCAGPLPVRVTGDSWTRPGRRRSLPPAGCGRASRRGRARCPGWPGCPRR